jgi:hypothetical protein
MKLLHCSKCNDVRNLVAGSIRKCSCGSSGGIYEDHTNAVLWGPYCRPLAIANEDLAPNGGGAYKAGYTELVRSWWIKYGACDAHEITYTQETPEKYADSE